MTEKTSEKLNAINKIIESAISGRGARESAGALEKRSKTNNRRKGNKIAILDLPRLR